MAHEHLLRALTDAEIDAVTDTQWGRDPPPVYAAHRAYARAVLNEAARKTAGRGDARAQRWLNPDHIRLHAGEVTPEEMLTVLAVVPAAKTAVLKMVSTVFVEKNQTADYTMTVGIRKIVADGKADGDGIEVTKQELMAHMEARALTTEEHELRALADAIIEKLPEQGYLTISPAMQWRLQYKRVMEKAGTVDGVLSVYKTKPLATSDL